MFCVRYFTRMNDQPRDVLPPVQFTVKLFVRSGVVRADIRRDVPGIAWCGGEPVREEVPATEVVNVPSGVTNLCKIMQERFLVMAAGHGPRRNLPE